MIDLLFSNPLDFRSFNCQKLSLMVNDREFVQEMDVGLKQASGLFYNMARTLGPRLPIGQFAIDRVNMAEGFFFCCFDMTTWVIRVHITKNFSLWNTISGVET